MRRFLVLLTACALLAALPVTVAARSGPTSARGVDPAIAYWTAARIAHAIPRDFVRLPNGKFVPAARPPGSGGGGGGGGVTGKSWPNGGTIVEQSGRVLFTLGGVDYICSASVVDDNNDASYSVIITAAHCAYDEVANEFATNWVYYPSFDTSPTYSCQQATYGCWEAKELVVHHGFADRPGFDDIAVQYDWAFAIVGTGGNGGNPQLDSHGSYQVAISTAPSTGYAFGYPAAGKYHGLDLTYCSGAIGTDPYNNDNNWKIVCDMTGGSSGGPWLQDTTAPQNLATEGRVFSLNSYGYSGVKAMHGPKFNSNTTTSYNRALSDSPNPAQGSIVGVLVP